MSLSVGRGSLAAVLVASLLSAACGSSKPDATDPRVLRADGATLTAAIARDPAPQILGEADGMIDDRKPVRAAEVMRTAAVPAVRRQIERVGALQPRSAEGRALQERTLRAYRARLRAIEQYAAALARGEIEDETLLLAVRAHRLAEEEVLDVIGAAQQLGHPPLAVPAGERSAAPRAPSQ